LTLRPDVFVDVEFTASFPPAVTVPSDAIVDSGRRKIVFVDRGGEFSGAEYMVRGRGYIRNKGDIENTVLAASEDGTPIRIRDIG
jgi:hypothetical protein